MAEERLALRVAAQRLPGALASYLHRGKLGYPPALAPPSGGANTVHAANPRLRCPRGSFRHRRRAASERRDPRRREQERRPAHRRRLSPDGRAGDPEEHPPDHRRRDDARAGRRPGRGRRTAGCERSPDSLGGDLQA